MSALSRLDKERGTLRILKVLSFQKTRLSRGLQILLMEHEGVGRTAFYRSLNCLKELGLLEDYQEKHKKTKLTFSRLTSKGRAIAEKIEEIAETLITEKDSD